MILTFHLPSIDSCLHKTYFYVPMDVQVSLSARQLIHALLNRDPASRLGSNGGSSAIKEHAFFRGINWPLIRCMVCPLVFCSGKKKSRGVNFDPFRLYVFIFNG